MHPFTRFFQGSLGDDSRVIVTSLIYLRLLVLGAVGLLIVLLGFYYQMPFSSAAVGTIAVLVAGWSMLVLASPALTEGTASAVRELLFDFVWVFGLVFFVGRSANPFIYYYLVLVVISAFIFSTRTAWFFCLGGILGYSSIMLLDTGVHLEHFTEDYQVHLAGMWLNYVGSSLVICYFVNRLANMMRDQQLQLSTAREKNLKNEQLIGIGTVAASTVHSLATPLSTLTVVAEDLVDRDRLEADVREDLLLMLAQVNRCKETIKNLASLAQGDGTEALSVMALKSELEEYYSLHSPGNALHFIAEPSASQYQISGHLLFLHALINLTNNAIEAGGDPVRVEFVAQEEILKIVISNQALMPADVVFERWGKPRSSEKPAGLGIGSLLANSTIEQLGGTVHLQADQSQEKERYAQVKVTITLPLE